MAKFDLYYPSLVKWEGSEYEDVEGDSGGATKLGVILSQWVKYGYDKDKDGDIDKFDLMKIDDQDAIKIAKTHYWDSLKCDLIKNQSVAELIMDACYNQGQGYTAPMVQRIVGVQVDGIFGLKTIEAINNFDQETLFNRIKSARKDRYINIVNKYPKNKKFLKGWLNRLDYFKFKNNPI